MSQISPSASKAAAPVPCPRCKQPLVDPKGLGWCKACGYCRSLAETEAKTSKPVASQPNTLTATGDALAQTPVWMWTCLLGAAFIMGATVFAERSWTLTDFHRALFCTIQVVLGVAMMFTGQFIGLLRVAPEDPSLSFKDAVFPFRLYGIIFKRLPMTQYAVYLGVWGFIAIVTASLFVGGMGHWFTYLPKANNLGYKVEKLPKG
jgi:hypothetical protein